MQATAGTHREKLVCRNAVMRFLCNIVLRAEHVMLQVSSLKPDAAEAAELRQRVAELQPEAEKAQVTWVLIYLTPEGRSDEGHL